MDRSAKKDSYYISKERIEYLIKKCMNYAPVENIYFSGGEPLLHPDLEYIIGLCDQYPKTLFTFTTNGLMINDSFVKMVEEKNNICIQLSVDGLDKDTYEFIRGEGTFEKFQSVLNMLSNSRIKHLTARTCVTRVNYKKISEIYTFLFNNRFMPSFLFVYYAGNARKNWNTLSLTTAQKLKAARDINILNKQHSEYPDIGPLEPLSQCNFTEEQDVKSLFIKFDGEVVPCQFFYEKSIGNIFINEISDILDKNNLKWFYETAKEREKRLSLSSTCRSCFAFDLCKKGCFGEAVSNGNPYGYDNDCDYRMKYCVMYSSGILTDCFKMEGDKNE